MNAIKSLFKSKSRARGTFKTVVINGCHAGGLGASIIKILAENAVHVIGLSNDYASLSVFEKNLNISAIIYAPDSPSEFGVIRDLVKLKLNGETLDAVINAGDIGIEPVSGSPTGDIIERYDIHLDTTRRLFLALEDFLITSHGAIINLTCFKMLAYEHCITNPPNMNGGIAALTRSLHSKLAAHDVKVMIVVHEPGTGLSSDGTGSWRDAKALAEDILRDMSTLPIFGKPF